jgi:hypothetical protein
MTVEQRLEQLEKRNKRLTVALTMMAVTICAVVTMAATGDVKQFGNADFDTLTAKRIIAEGIVVTDAHFTDTERKVRIILDGPKGSVIVMGREAEKPQIYLSTNENGGFAQFVGRSGEATVKIFPDESGNGVVGVYNRKGEGKVIKPGP